MGTYVTSTYLQPEKKAKHYNNVVWTATYVMVLTYNEKKRQNIITM